MSTATTPQAFRSKYGWHAVDYPTFRLIKEYHWLMLRAYRLSRRWERTYFRKTVYFAVPEPPVVPGFLFVGRDCELYQRVLAAYRAVRRPAPDPEAVWWPGLPTDWVAQLKALRKHFEE